MFRRRYVPHSTLLELTLRCNMRCIHCGSSAGNSRDEELTTDEWQNVCNQLAELNCDQITLLGGEPLIRQDWYEIAQHIRNLGLKLAIISNGYQINENIINQFRRLEPHTIAISLDGATAEKHDSIRGMQGSFERCINSLKLLRNADLNTTIITTVHKMNLKDLPEIRNQILNRNIAWQIQIANPIGRFPKNLTLSKEEFYSLAMFIASTRKQYSIRELPITGAHCIGYCSSILPNLIIGQWRGCQAGIHTLGIQSNGGVKGCLSLTDEFTEGNIRENTISEIWNDPNFSSYNRNFTREDLNNECGNCKYGRNCRGGCLSVSTSLTGKKHGDPYCLHLIEKEMVVR
jgi:radical SAM protein with 4Fe4S-binding SPASM domain